MSRESLSGRLGFILLAAGCAVGLGNVWRFPYVVGANGGGAFVLIYFFFLALMGLPLLVAELSIGRASRLGITGAYPALANPSYKKIWRILGVTVFLGNLILMIYYTDVAGWLAKYCFSYIHDGGGQISANPEAAFTATVASKPQAFMWTLFVAVFAGLACALGVVKGIERIAKVMMLSLIVLLVVLAVKALTLPGAKAALEFYIKPDWARFAQEPVKIIFAAMGQAFFTLSFGIGCMKILGSYTDRKHSLVKESLFIISIDTFVALLSGLVVFPSCFSYGLSPESGPGLVFVAMPKIFAAMNGGVIWGALFFLFLLFAAFTTVMAVFECLIGGLSDERKMKRVYSAAIVVGVVAILSLPCVLWGGVLEMEDFAVSQIWLPVGALLECIFVSTAFGWGWSKFRAEASEGNGIKMPSCLKFHLKYVLPIMILFILIFGFVQYFKG
jgi:NSS family neurotransmitter:Na+ symporter